MDYKGFEILQSEKSIEAVKDGTTHFGMFNSAGLDEDALGLIKAQIDQSLN